MSMTCPGGVYYLRSATAIVPAIYYTNASHQGYSTQAPSMLVGICAGDPSNTQWNISSGYLPESSDFSPSLQGGLGYNYFNPHNVYYPPTSLDAT